MATPEKDSKVALYKAEINKQVGDAETFKSLIATTFTNKGVPMDGALVKRALLEGLIRGFTFDQFLNKDVYAIPFADGYSLVTSIDYSRKIGAKSGIVGVDAPAYTEKDDRVVSCSMTVKKKIGEYVGDFTAEVYFSEYSTGKNLWSSKPRTMISKVAEMHALRKACPEELSQSYVEEEIQRETIKEPVLIDLTSHEQLLRSCKTIEALEVIWADMPGDAKAKLKPVMEEMKAILLTEAKDVV